MGAFGKSGTEFLRNQLYFNQIGCDVNAHIIYERVHKNNDWVTGAGKQIEFCK